jgi:peptide/nickel transport system substrate-binding protein
MSGELEDGSAWRWRLDRRTLLRGAGVGGAGLTVAAFAACRTSERPAPASVNQPAVSKQPRRGGTIVHSGGDVASYDTRGTTLDPHINSALGASTFRHFYQGLVGYDLRTYEVRPELAQRWEQRSPTEYVFTLQPNVKWHNKPPANGRALTAADVVFSLERARTNDARFTGRSLLANVDKIEAPDTGTVRITTRSPDAATLSNLSGDILMVLAPEVVDKAGRFTTAEAVVGTGAFIMQSVEEQVGAEYVRNPDYWKPGLPYLDGIRTQHFSEEGSAWAAYLAGKIDICRVPGTEVKKFISQQTKDYVPAWDKDPGVLMMNPNTRVKPFDDARVCRALRLLIDHQEFITAWGEVWFGRGRHGSIFPTALDTWDLSEEEYGSYLEWKAPKDDAVKEALALLAAAGFTRQTPLKFELANQGIPPGTFSEAFAQLILAQWKRLGQGVVEPENKAYDLASSNTVRANRSYSYFVGGNQAGSNEVDAWLSQIYKTDASRNYANFSDPRLDAMIDRQRGIFDVAQRKQAVREIILYMIEHGPTTIPANRFFLSAARPQIQDFEPEFYMRGSQYEKLWLEG